MVVYSCIWLYTVVYSLYDCIRLYTVVYGACLRKCPYFLDIPLYLNENNKKLIFLQNFTLKVHLIDSESKLIVQLKKAFGDFIKIFCCAVNCDAHTTILTSKNVLHHLEPISALRGCTNRLKNISNC